MRIVGFSSYSLAANQPMKSITEADKKQLTPEEAHLQFLSQRGKAMDRPALLWRELPFFRDIIERFMGFVGIVHGMQWEICYIVSLPCFWAISLGTVLQFLSLTFGMIFGFGTRQC